MYCFNWLEWISCKKNFLFYFLSIGSIPYIIFRAKILFLSISGNLTTKEDGGKLVFHRILSLERGSKQSSIRRKYASGGACSPTRRFPAGVQSERARIPSSALGNSIWWMAVDALDSHARCEQGGFPIR